MQRRFLVRGVKPILAGSLALVVCACGGPRGGNFDQPSGGSKLAGLLGFSGSGQTQTGSQAGRLFCPSVIVLEGTAAAQFHAGDPPSNTNLRYQYSLGDAARECSLEGDQILLKVGMAGKVLLGPAGSPGSFTVPVRVAVVRERDNQALVSKLYKAAATIGSGQTQADFTIISEPMRVPFIQDHAELDYVIKVGIDTTTAPEKPRGKPDPSSPPS